MSKSGWITLRAASAASLALGTFAVGCAGPNAGEAASLTAKSWSSDKYVVATDPRTMSMNAARVLAEPERTVQRTMQVGAAEAVMHERASATSRPIGTLKAGQAVKVLAEGNIVRIPATAAMREYVGVKGGDLTPSWVKVSSNGTEGWVPALALVVPIEYATASDALAASRAAGAGKGFSEKVENRAVAMKGAAGTPKLQKANYVAADAIIAQAKQPLNFNDAGSPWEPSQRLSNLPAMGGSLATVDPAAYAKAQAALAKANEPGDASKGADVGVDLLSGFGVVKADDDKVKILKGAAEIGDILIKSLPVTPVEERTLGRECLAQFIGKSKVLPDSDPTACYVRWVGTKLAANSTTQYPSLGLDFIVVDDKSVVNAVAVPGGPIVITTGMLAFLESEDELASILGHELTHVEERHGLKLAMGKGLDKWSSVLSVLELEADGKLDPFIEQLVGQMKLPDIISKQVVSLAKEQVLKLVKDSFKDVVLETATAMNTGSDKGAETGADLRGMSLAAAAGYDPYALDIVLERLKSKTGQYGGANYDEKRADLARSVVGMLPTPVGSAPAAKAVNDKQPAPHMIAPSKDAVDRWSKLDAELKKS
jgi:hypothetical protein